MSQTTIENIPLYSVFSYLYKCDSKFPVELIIHILIFLRLNGPITLCFDVMFGQFKFIIQR